MGVGVQLVFDLLGVFFFAMSGSLLAGRKGFDLIGSLLLGSLAGLGGGVARDVIIGGPIAAFTNPLYLIPPVVAALVVYFLWDGIRRFQRWLVIFDAGGLALFCVTGTVKSLEFGMHPVASVLLGVTTAVGGGVLRDITAREVPTLFDARDLYAVPAFFGAALTAVLVGLGWFNTWTMLVVVVLVFSFRVAAWRFQWSAPRAVWKHSEEQV